METLKQVGEFLFVPINPTARSRILAILFLLLVYTAGAVHWIFFFHGGEMTFQANDWPKEYSYYSVLQQAVQEGRLPFHLDHPFQGTYRFLANPETVLSPQIILLKWLGIGQFVLVNVLFMYSIFFAGCMLLMRRYRLPPFAFLLLFVLAGFNGHITAHLAAGHSMWNGVFLLPFFCLTVLDLVENQPSPTRIIKVAAVIFGIFLQGSFHIAVWCYMFLAFLAAGSWRLIRPVVGVIAVSAFLTAFRLIPTVMTFSGFSFPYISGYPDLRVLFEALTVLRLINYTHIGGYFGTLGWHEYDAYVGLVGLAIIVVFGIGFRVRKGAEWDSFRYPALDVPVIMMTFFSVNYSFAAVAQLNLPLIAGERVASRFLIIPLVFLIVLASIRMGQYLPKIRKSTGAKVLLAVLFLDLASALVIHSINWRISRMENTHPRVLYDGIYHIYQVEDPAYMMAVSIGSIITLFSLVAVAVYTYYQVKGKLVPR